MIRQVHFENFRCLRDVTLTLEPLTVLVGPNSSGKTTTLSGLRRYNNHNLGNSDFWNRDTSKTIRLRWDDDIEITAASGGQSISFPSGIAPPKRNTQPLILNLAALRQENTLSFAHRLAQDGSNLTNVFSSLTRHQQAAVAEELCRLVPMFSDVDVLPTEMGRHRLRFQDRWSPDFWPGPDEVSDGTMLVLAFIVLQYQTPQVDLITIEEPERALHPYLLDELIQLLRKMTTGEIGKKPVQVVLATHSAELLEYVRPEEVRFLTRSPKDGSVQVNQAATGTENWRRVYEEYKRSLGSIWLSGGMGGVPGE